MLLCHDRILAAMSQVSCTCHHHLCTCTSSVSNIQSCGRAPPGVEPGTRVEHVTTGALQEHGCLRLLWIRLLWIVMQVDAELGTTFNEVLAPQDIATYGALCSLASFSRPEMKTRIIDNIAFREFLELMPEVWTNTCRRRSVRILLVRSHAAASGQAAECKGTTHILRLELCHVPAAARGAQTTAGA